MAELMFFDIGIAVIFSTILAVLRSWFVQRRYHRSSLFMRTLRWEGLELSFSIFFLPLLGLVSFGYLAVLLSSPLGIGQAQYIFFGIGGGIGMLVIQRLFAEKLYAQLTQAIRDQEITSTISPPQPPQEP